VGKLTSLCTFHLCICPLCVITFVSLESIKSIFLFLCCARKDINGLAPFFKLMHILVFFSGLFIGYSRGFDQTEVLQVTVRLNYLQVIFSTLRGMQLTSTHLQSELVLFEVGLHGVNRKTMRVLL